MTLRRKTTRHKMAAITKGQYLVFIHVHVLRNRFAFWSGFKFAADLRVYEKSRVT